MHAESDLLICKYRLRHITLSSLSVSRSVSHSLRKCRYRWSTWENPITRYNLQSQVGGDKLHEWVALDWRPRLTFSSWWMLSPASSSSCCNRTRSLIDFVLPSIALRKARVRHSKPFSPPGPGPLPPPEPQLSSATNSLKRTDSPKTIRIVLIASRTRLKPSTSVVGFLEAQNSRSWQARVRS